MSSNKPSLQRTFEIHCGDYQNNIRERLHCNQWRNTSNVVNWVQNNAD